MLVTLYISCLDLNPFVPGGGGGGGLHMVSTHGKLQPCKNVRFLAVYFGCVKPCYAFFFVRRLK